MLFARRIFAALLAVSSLAAAVNEPLPLSAKLMGGDSFYMVWPGDVPAANGLSHAIDWKQAEAVIAAREGLAAKVGHLP